jgi:hypothetical protein
MEVMTLMRVNIQNSVLRDRPSKSAYFFNAAKYQFIVVPFPPPHIARSDGYFYDFCRVPRILPRRAVTFLRNLAFSKQHDDTTGSIPRNSL